MILQALKEYYDRKLATNDPKIPRFGWEWKEIQYVVVIDKDGNPRDIQDTTEGSGKDKRFHSFYVPKDVERSSNIDPNLLWDNLEYAFGIVPKNGSKEKTEERHRSFQRRIEELGDIDDEGICALKKFVALSLEEKLEKFEKIPADKQIIWNTLRKDGNALVTFKLLGCEDVLVCSSKFVHRYEQSINNKKGKLCFCPISGEYDNLKETHYKIKGIKNGQKAGTRLVSFNKVAFESFEKEQGANSPIGEKAVFAYTTALNTMLNEDSPNHLYLNDTTVVFWGQEDSDVEKNLKKVFNPDKNIKEVISLFNSIYIGTFTEPRKKNLFYILGLAPNNARLAVRFWTVSTIKKLSENIVNYFEEITIAHSDKEPDYLSFFRLLVSTAIQGKPENIPSNLEGDLMRAILEGHNYPQSLLSTVVRRIRAENGETEKGNPKPKVSYERAALLKAFFNRKIYLAKKLEREKSMNNTDQTTNNNQVPDYGKWEKIEESLTQNTQIGYRLGRLFATLEKIQSEANPGINATIRERFYGAASSTPVVVFPTLINLKNHHLHKIENEGRKVYFENLLCEILSAVDSFPSNLLMEQQGLFALGYYHQLQYFYTKKSDKQEVQDAETNNE